MSVRVAASFGLLLVTLTARNVWAEERVEQRTFGQCFLYQGSGGNVWVGHPLVSLGMIGVRANPPVYRLSPALAERFKPLLNELAEPPNEPEFWFWRLPDLADDERPLVLIRIATNAVLQDSERPAVHQEGPGVIGSSQSAVYEITSAELTYAEFLTPVWLRAWKSLDTSLTQIVTISRMALGDQKTQRLAEAIEQASSSLIAMTAESVTPSQRDVVRKIQPQARAVRLFQSGIEGAGIGQWGAQLRDYCSRLRIDPETPLPQPSKARPLVQLLADSSAAPELLATVRASWPEATLDERLIFSEELDRTIFLWQVQYLDDVEFQMLRRQAKAELAEATKAVVEPPPASPVEEVSVEPWNVVLRRASANRIAQLGLLSGTVVHRVSDGGSPIGLQKGDVIVDDDSVYDLVMAGHTHFGLMKKFAGQARYDGQLHVIRDNRLMCLEYSGASDE